ncbi:MAG TPA: rod shape-determining protein MreC [Burkholderiaceae bacterium]|jgi:rod shape-determining protein MreC|nr:rod shape-determining protein MreC [Burkholderiaceae bacterium]
MEYGPPPLFNQGVSARARLAFFSFLAILLIVIDARVNALDTIRIGVGVMLYPLQRVLLWPRDALASAGRYLVTVGNLTQENAQLRESATERAARLLQDEQLRLENAHLRQLLALRERTSAKTQSVQLLYEPRDRFTHKLVIDRGSSDGLRAGNPVIDEQGVVGQITRVFPMVSEVTVLTERDQSIPVEVVRNALRCVAFGGSEPGTLELHFLAANADVSSGDTVVTSGLDGLYPAGLPVGTIARVERDVKDQFARVIVRPAGGVNANGTLVVLQVTATPLPAPSREDQHTDHIGRRGARR